MKIKIIGRVISKKNSKRIVTNRYSGKRMVLSSKAYERFKEDALTQLLTVKEKFKGKVHIDYIFNIKGKMRIDLDNAIASINDILQDAGIIEDDNLIVSIEAKKIQGCTEWTTYLKISEVLEVFD